MIKAHIASGPGCRSRDPIKGAPMHCVVELYETNVRWIQIQIQIDSDSDGFSLIQHKML